MTDNEIKFFKTCYNLTRKKVSVKFSGNISYEVPEYHFEQIIRFVSEFITEEKCLYFLEKWNKLGFYKYCTTIKIGYFLEEKFPEQYKNILEGINVDMNAIQWNPIKKSGNPETSGLYLVTTKTTGCVAQRRYDARQNKWSFGEPSAWAYMPKAYVDLEAKNE